MNSSLTGIVSSFLELKAREREFVLATIVETSGSTYRKAGARLLITRSGRFYGLLGGGCFEADLLEHAYEVFERKQTQTLYYDMRGPEDLVWGLGLGCNGAVRIRIEYLSEENGYAPLTTIEKGLALNRKCVVASICESTHPDFTADRHYLVSLEDESSGEESLPGVFRELAVKSLYAGACILETLELDGHGIEIFLAPVIPPLRLLIIGGGPDSIPVIDNAKLLGWNVSIVDYRDAYSRPENFPEGVRVIQSSPEDLTRYVDPRMLDAVVLMTHKFEYDLRYLKNFIDTEIPYVGLLGPAARKEELIRSLAECPDGFKDRIFGPVGLNIGGELPEEIALSLVAGIQAVINRRPGGYLSGGTTEPDRSGEQDDLSVIVLAAGGSSRFGALKQLLEYKGKSLLKRAVEAALQLDGGEVLVVHGPKATKCQREISACQVVNLVNDDWENGISTSLLLAIESLSSGSDAALIMLCDQPLVDREKLQQLIALWRKNPDRIVASAYADTIGVPAIIPRSYFGELKKLKGDSGAKKILSVFSDQLLTLAVPEAEFDIDTEKDFSDLLLRKPA